jgi:hypothetical protein
MKQIMIRFFALMSTLPVSGMVIAHPGHEGAGGGSHHFVGVDHMATLFVLVLVVGCCWAFARRQ